MSYPRHLNFNIATLPSILLDPTTLWFDFTKASTIYKDAVGTNVTADGDSIKIIRDSNGRAFCLNSSVAGWLTYKTNIVNGKSVGRMANTPGNTSSLFATTVAGGGIPTGSALNLSSVFTAGKNAMTAVMAINLTADGTLRGVLGDNVGGYWYSRVILSAGQCQVTFSCFDVTVDKQVSLTYTNSSWAVLSWRQGATQNQARRNNGAFSNVACTGPASLANQFRLGQGFTSNAPAGDVAHVVTFASALSDAELTAVERYIGSTVGIVI